MPFFLERENRFLDLIDRRGHELFVQNTLKRIGHYAHIKDKRARSSELVIQLQPTRNVVLFIHILPEYDLPYKFPINGGVASLLAARLQRYSGNHADHRLSSC